MSRPLEIVAELSVFTLGHSAYMRRLIREAKQVGCTGVKLQMRTPAVVYTQEKLDSPYESMFGTTYREYREGLEHSYEDFVQAGYACESDGLQLYTSVYDEPAAKRLRFTFIYNKLKVPGSRLHDRMLLVYLNEKLAAFAEKSCLIISVGSIPLAKVDEAIDQLNNINDIVICHTVNNYPTADSDVLLGNIEALKERYKGDRRIRLGYSGHDMNAHIGVAAVELGCTYIERHFAINPGCLPVHHQLSCWSPEQMRRQVEALNDREVLTVNHAWMRMDLDHVSDYMAKQSADQRVAQHSRA